MGASEEFYTRSDWGFIRINLALGGRVSELGGGEAAHWPGNQDKGWKPSDGDKLQGGTPPSPGLSCVAAFCWQLMKSVFDCQFLTQWKGAP